MNEVVFDASAVLALIKEEAGCKIVESHLGRASISTVNLSEVVAQLIKGNMNATTALTLLHGLGLQTIVFDEKMAFDAALLLTLTQKLGLSFGDRACLALAGHLKLPVITADRAWNKLKLSIDIRLIR